MTIDEQIKKADAKIAEIEAALIVAQEHRRELVNRGNLNKPRNGGSLPPGNMYVIGEHGPETLAPNECEHSWNYNQDALRRWCRKCGATQAIDDASFEGVQE